MRRLRGHTDRGASALEFALIMPVVMLIFTAVADLGNALQQSVRLEAAARAGAQVAFTSPGDTQFTANDPNATLVKNAVLSYLSGWAAASTCTNGIGNGVCVTYTSWCQCPRNDNVASTTYAFNCNADTPPCEDMQRYASVTATRNYSPLLYVPVTTLRGNVELRVR